MTSRSTSTVSTKEKIRRLAASLMRVWLRLGSRPFELHEGTTLVVAPHQDDETLACGGMIAAKRADGLPVHVAFITDGAASHPGHPDFDPAAIAELRRDEARRALACLHVEHSAVHFFNQPDGTLHRLSSAARVQLIDNLASLLSKLAPTEIFIPCRPDGSSEHDATVEFVVAAWRQSGARAVLWQYPVWAWWNPLRLARRWLTSNDCRRLVVGDEAVAKQAAIACYRSQIAPLPPQSAAALPSSLLQLGGAGAEYFFRHEPPSP